MSDAVDAAGADRLIAKKTVDRLTLGELKQIAAGLAKANHPAAGRLPNISSDELHLVIDLRNKFSHGQQGSVAPQEVMERLPRLLEIMRLVDRDD